MKKKYSRPRKNIREPFETNLRPSDVWSAAATVTALAQVFAENYYPNDKNGRPLFNEQSGFAAWGLKRYLPQLKKLLKLSEEIVTASGSLLMNEEDLNGTPIADSFRDSIVDELLIFFRGLKKNNLNKQQIQAAINDHFSYLNDGTRRLLISEVSKFSRDSLTNVATVQEIVAKVLGFTTRTMQTVRARNKAQKVIPTHPELKDILKHWYGYDCDEIKKVCAALPPDTWEYKMKKVRELKQKNR